MRLLLLTLLCISAMAQTIYMPTGTTPATQISSCTGTSPTICTTITDHGLSAGDIVLVYMIVEYTGSIDQLSAINAPSGSARKVGAANLTHNTLTFTDLAGTAVNTSNTVLVNSGFLRKAAVSSIPAGPRVGLDGTGNPIQMAVSATIADSTLTNIVVTGGNLATVNYAYPHNLATGNRIQVRNAAQSGLNGIKTVTVTSSTALTYSTSATNGTYTDANLGVSSRAIDGEPAWEKIKAIAAFADSGHANFIYQVSGGEEPFNNCAGAAYYWYVDRSQSAMKTFAISNCIDKFEDFLPGPEFCSETGTPGVPYCPNGGNNRAATTDYIRYSVTNAATLYTLMRSQLTNTEKTNFRNFFLNDTPDSCTHPSWSQGAGTFASSGTAITGTGTSFTTAFTVGDYIFAWSGGSSENTARIITITDDTHMVVTSNFPGFSAGSSYWVVPAFLSAGAGSGAGCGVLNMYRHHRAGTGTRDARLYIQPAPTGAVEAAGDGTWLPPKGDWIVSQGNNQTNTATFSDISAASAFAEDDARAVRLLQENGAWNYDYIGGEIIGTWGGLLKAGPYYGLGRTVVFGLGTLAIGQRSVTGFPDILASPHNLGVKSQIYQLLYTHLPASSNSDPYFMPWSYLGGELTSPEQFSSLGALEGLGATTETQYMRYFLSHKTNWGSGSYYTQSPLMMALLDPNAATELDYTTLPLQVQLASNDSSYCGSLGLTCANGSPSFVQSTMERASVVSRTAWTGNATVMLESNLGGVNDVGASPSDHGATIPGNYHILKASTSGLGGCLIGDNDNLCVFGNGPGYSTGMLTATTSLAAGTVTQTSNGTTNAIYGPTLLRWSGADRFGDSTSRYSAATWETANYFALSEGVTRAQRTFIDFKKSGTDQFVMIYDNAAKSSGTVMAGYTQYPQGAPTGCCTGGSLSYSGGLLTETNTDNFRLMTRWLAPAGATSLAVINDGSSYSGNQGDTMATRLTHCASSNGSTCNTSATSMEAIQAHYVTTNSNSALTATLISPDSNWTCGQVTGATDTKLGCFARGGSTLSNVTGFTPSFSGTAQWVFSGMAPGIYSITVGGSSVAGSPFTVTAGDNSIYFESTSGAMVLTATVGGSLSTGKVKISGKAVIH